MWCGIYSKAFPWILSYSSVYFKGKLTSHMKSGTRCIVKRKRSNYFASEKSFSNLKFKLISQNASCFKYVDEYINFLAGSTSEKCHNCNDNKWSTDLTFKYINIVENTKMSNEA